MPDIELRGAKEEQARMIATAKKLHGPEFTGALQNLLINITGDARRAAPADRGALRASILPAIKVRGTDVYGVVGSNKTYAPMQELGTKPFWPNMTAIQAWAQRKGVDAFVVARAISRRGIKPKLFLTKAFLKNQHKVQGVMEAGVTRAIKD